MKKSNYMEIIGILSLSLLITSTMAISGGVPEMMKTFCANSSSIYTRSSVELLVSIPGFSIMVIIALTPILTRYIKEKFMICSGLLIIGIAGVIPFFINAFPIIFLCRICLGIGIGLVNTLAVTLIGERFSGELRQKLQGIRCSMETLGEASLIFIAGQLLTWGWNYSFLVYGFAFVILLLYLFFVPETQAGENIPPEHEEEINELYKITKQEYIIIIKNALLGGLLVSTLSANALRISSFVVESALGSSIDGSTILSISILAGFVGGLCFGKILKKLSKFVLPFSCLFMTSGFIILVSGGTLIAVALGASICGFFSTIALSYMFNALSDHLPTKALTTGNALVLVGCNLGSTVSPFILKLAGYIHPSLSAGFLAYAGIYFILGTSILLLTVKKR